MLDQAENPRAGEELNLPALQKYLQKALPNLDAPLEILQFPSGHSNLTYLLRAGESEIVLRRPPFGRKPKSGHDMRREWRMLEALQGAFPYSPKALHFCEDTAIFGAPFYIMERIHGLILRKNIPTDLSLPPAELRKLCEHLIDVHKELHALNYQDLGLADFGKPAGYVARQISGWTRRYRDARTPNVPAFEKVMTWLEANLPPERGSAIIHNDYRFDNLVLDPKTYRVIGVLDWEMATIGDPLMDLGASLAYWIQADDPSELRNMRLGPTDAPGALTRQEVIQRYLQGSEVPENDLVFYYVYGLFRLAGIAQQIYWRFYHEQTRDKRFQHFDQIVAILERASLRAMEEDSI
ncbi:MAG: phosphotransferase family protein [Chloroflexi bacterium]|nr:MAG: phosphotransferase family protein [Chloroflexota bacterium]